MENSGRLPHEAADIVVDIQSLEASVGDFTLSINKLISISGGRSVALIGHNGAGKSFLLETLAGYNRTTSSVGTLLNRPIGLAAIDLELKKKLGVQLRRNAWPQDVSVRDLVALHKGLYPVQDVAVANALKLQEIESTRYGALSTGQRQRVDLFMALAHRPALALLDEPGSGLDSNFADQLRALIVRRSAKESFLFAVHEDVALDTADMIIWLSGGRVIASGPKDQVIRDSVGTYFVRMEASLAHDIAGLQHELKDIRGVVAVFREGQILTAFGNDTLVDYRSKMDLAPVSYSEGPSTTAHFLSIVGKPS